MSDRAEKLAGQAQHMDWCIAQRRHKGDCCCDASKAVAAIEAALEEAAKTKCLACHDIESHNAALGMAHAAGLGEERVRWRAIFCEAHHPTPPPEVPGYCPRCLGEEEGHAAMARAYRGGKDE